MRWNCLIVIELIFAHWTVTVYSQNADKITKTATPDGTETYTAPATAPSQDDYLNATSYPSVILNIHNSNPSRDGSFDTTGMASISQKTILDQSDLTTERIRIEKFDPEICRYYPIPPKEYKEECCKYTYGIYTRKWVAGSYYLVTILDRMQRWGCHQFKTECEYPTWPFTEYTLHMYDLFCRRSKMEHACYDIVYETSQKYKFHPSFNMTWKTLIETLNSNLIRFQDLIKPCVQVALYDREDGGVGRFHEIVEPFTPFCGLQWQGYDYNTAVFRGVSVWTGMSIWCQSSVVICMIVIAVAGIITTISNLLVLVVFGTTPRLRNSQAIYKISLGAADLLVGVVVWPNMIILQYLTFWTPRTMGRFVRYPYLNSTDMTPYDNTNLTYRYGGGDFDGLFPTEYVFTVGFVTMLCLMVSIYTLMVASFDRFSAVFRPLRYNRHNAKRQAIISSAAVWIGSAVVCLLPIFTPGFQYRVTASNLINVEGPEALVFIFIALILPLIVTWVITGLTFQTSRKHARARQKIVSSTANRSNDLERRLAKTLFIMVGAFTLSILPTICCTVAGFASAVTTWQMPQNLNLTAATAYTTSEYLAIIVLTSNSIWNFLIYSFRTRGFRDVASDVMNTFRKNTGIEYLRRGVRQVVSGARRVSLSTMMNMRRFSTPDTSDSRKKSVTTLTGTSKITDSSTSSSGRPSVDYKYSSVFAGSSTDTDRRDSSSSSTYTKSGSKSSQAQSGVEIRAERKKAIKKEELEEYAGEDSTFGSFAIDARTDRLFESVMENVPEEIEPAPVNENMTNSK